MGEDGIVDGTGGVHDLQTAVWHCETGRGGRTFFLGEFGGGVLSGESAVGGDPVFGVMWFLERIADAGVTGCEDAGAFTFETRWIEREIHQFVHVAEDEHVAV